MTAHAAPVACEPSWPAWESFKKNFIDEEGRVIDNNTGDMRTTSEGQAYALFFALVANDRTTFDKLFNWTEINLAEGDLTTRLPAWLWGRREAGDWGILDENSASDADLWLAYTAGEAGRLWTDRRYVALSSLMANRILNVETAEVAHLGLVLLPGSNGFQEGGHVRLNPSYLPMQLMRWFANRSKDPRWTALTDSSLQIIVNASAQGYAPDWTLYDEKLGFVPVPETDKRGIGSYDAIRVYLWAGLLNRDDPARRLLTDRFKPMAQFISRQHSPPESIEISTGTAYNSGPVGFSAAVLPFLLASGLKDTALEQVRRLNASPPGAENYYDQVLTLYATGWLNKLYHFDLKGNLITRWISKCQ
ncbi:MAG: endo-1,4-D-glucanase [Gallionellales bacterium RIFOXYB12_FULL_54_9]|nr:MAG: endo-1,4-D-glucanase [Gallionellales bacterium RIFOXYB12_FULL_54_9]